MIFLAIQTAILSLLFIAIIHTIYIFLKDNLTTPKIKDLVNKPTEQYGEIYKSMKNTKSNEKDMKVELQNYFAELTEKDPKIKQKEKAAPPPNNGGANNGGANKTNSAPITDFSFHSNTSSLQYQSL